MKAESVSAGPGTDIVSIQKKLPQWCEDVAALGVDMLLDEGLIQKEDLERATKIIAREILTRLCLGDYPPADVTPPAA